MGVSSVRASKSEYITSPDNRWLKRFRAALHGRPESQDGQPPPLGLEGPHLVEEALRSKLLIEALLVADSAERHLTRLRKLLPPGALVLRTSDRLFTATAGTESPQGLAALVTAPAWTLDDLLGTNALVVAIAGVQDPGNVGTIVRTAEAFGATGLIACRGSAHPFAPKSLRASAGSALRLPLIAGLAPERALSDLQAHGLRQCAASLSGDCPPQHAGFSRPTALWIGSEAAGLPPEIEAAADARIRIPIAPAVESLNAAMAAAVILYEASRQRHTARTGFQPVQVRPSDSSPRRTYRASREPRR